MSDTIYDNVYYINFELMSSLLKTAVDDYAVIVLNSTTNCLRVDINPKFAKKLIVKEGAEISPSSLTYKCLKEKKPMISITPKELLGVSVKTTCVPVKNRRGQIIGCLSIGESVEERAELKELGDSTFEPLKLIASHVEMLRNNLEQIQEDNKHSLDRIFSINEQTNNTDDIINYINNVVTQSNLLGLNAKIESARVGEAGKGFAVVASEIQGLSKQSQAALSKITKMLNEIKGLITLIVNQLSDSNKQFEQQVEVIQEIDTKLKEIVSMFTTLQTCIQDFI